MKTLNQYIKESFGGSKEVKNYKLRKLLDNAGYKSIHLYKGDGYFYITDDGTDKEMEDIMAGVQDSSIYMNAFNQQSPEDWFVDIEHIINSGR